MRRSACAPAGRGPLGHAVGHPAVRRDDLHLRTDLPADGVGDSGFSARRPIPGQNTTLAVAAFVDNTDPPTSPRWYGYFNLWVATLSLPGCVVVVWMFTTTYVMLRSIGAQQTAEKQLVAAP